MTALVTENIALLAEAPQGISRLRALILELAIRGKLVPQDAEDEHPSEFFSRIDRGKAAKFTKGELARFESLASSPVDSSPFVIPPNWEWRRLGSLGLIGSSSRVHQKDWTSAGVPFYRTREIVQLAKTGSVEPDLFISEELYDELTQRGPGPAPGDIMLTGVGTIGVPYVVQEGDRFYFKDASVLIFKNHFEMSPEYLSLVFSSPYWKETIHKESMGTTVHTLTISRANEVLIPVAPAGEQARIVAKVDELMALCDRLEAEQAEAEAAHAKLVEALLASLTQARDAADFRASWQQLAEHFHTLFTTEASVEALKLTVLRLGVMGKLVANAIDGESASQLLARIAHARTAGKATSPTDAVQGPYELPPNWCWTTLPAVGELARGKSKHRPRNDPALYSGGTIPLVQTGDVARASGLINTCTGKYNALGLAQSRLWPAGTMCITIAANIADSAILGFDACFPDSVVGFIPGLPEVDVKYFEYFLRTAKADLQKFAPSTAQKNINLDILSSLYLPLPPLGELNRIVALVDDLFALCDQLKLNLAQARQHHEHLASVLVEQAVA